MKNLVSISIFSLIFILSCQNSAPKQVENQQNHKKEVEIEYANGFKIFQIPQGYLVQVNSPWEGNHKTYNYVLSRNKIQNENTADTTYIHIPVKRVICFSTTNLGYLEALDEVNSIVGMAQPNYVYNKKVYAKVQSGDIANLGNNQELNLEKILSLNPDVCFAFGINATSAQKLGKIQKLTHKVVLTANYMENTPLGKLEWVKFFAVFYDKLNEATKLFNLHKNNYIEIKKKAQSFKFRPTVFAGFPWKGTWYVPGGASFQAHFFKDAGADYIWKDNTETSGIPISVESVVAKAHDADIWVNLNAVGSLQEIKAGGKVLISFKAYKNDQVYNTDKRESTNGGYDYWESGVMNPDIILRDLVKIFHPKSFPNDSLYYYRKLK